MRDTVGKLHVKYCMAQDQRVPAYVDILEDNGAVVVDSIGDSGSFTKAVVHEHGELARPHFCNWAAQSTVPGGFKSPVEAPTGEASAPRLGHPNAKGAAYIVPSDGYPAHMRASEFGPAGWAGRGRRRPQQPLQPWGGRRARRKANETTQAHDWHTIATGPHHFS